MRRVRGDEERDYKRRATSTEKLQGILDARAGIIASNGLSNQPVNTLFFASGPDDEAHGLYGRVDVYPGY